MRGGKLYDSKWHARMSGHGPYAEGIEKTFDLFVKKLGLDQPLPQLDCSQFRPPPIDDAQLRLF